MNASGGLMFLFITLFKSARNELVLSAYCRKAVTLSLDWGTFRMTLGTD